MQFIFFGLQSWATHTGSLLAPPTQEASYEGARGCQALHNHLLASCYATPQEVASFPGLHPAFLAFFAHSHYITHTEQGRPGNEASQEVYSLPMQLLTGRYHCDACTVS